MPLGCRYGFPRDYMTRIILLHRWRPSSPPQRSQTFRWHPPHQMASGRKWVLLHEVQVSITVRIISIFEAFKYVVS
jgi:hypothetical protein